MTPKAGLAGLTACHSATTFWWSGVEDTGTVLGKVGGVGGGPDDGRPAMPPPPPASGPDDGRASGEENGRPG